MCDNLVEDLDDLLIDDLTPENFISTVHVNGQRWQWQKVGRVESALTWCIADGV
jgi:hypothetical protein